MDAEHANYVIEFYSYLLNIREKAGLKHYRQTQKIDDLPENEDRTALYIRTGWLSSDPEVLRLLDKGYDQFIFNCAERLLNEFPEKVIFNYCPVCGKLARTPQAKQCRYCKHDWH